MEIKCLKEARAYKFLRELEPEGIAFFGTRRSIPSLIFIPMDEQDIKTTQDAVVIKANPVSAKRYYQQVDSYHPFDVLYNDLYRGDANFKQHIDKMEEYPNLFKITRLKGRDRMFKFLTTDLGLSPDVWKGYFGETPEIGEDHATKFHNAVIMVPDNMSKAAFNTVMSTLEQTFQLLRQHGVGYVFGVKTRFARIGGRAQGRYFYEADEMLITPSIRKSTQVIYVLLHEYGHRLYRKFFNEQHHKAIRKKFVEMQQAGHRWRDTEKKHVIATARELYKLGAIVDYVGRKRDFKRFSPYIVANIEEDNVASLVPLKDPTFVRISAPLEALMKFNKWRPQGVDVSKIRTRRPEHELETNEWFPTKYSQMKDEEEWFCELFSLYLIGKLGGEPAAWVKELIS